MIKRTHKISRLLLLSLLVSFAGCESEEDEARKQAYDASFKLHQQLSFREGEKRGFMEGTVAGVAAATEAAETGRAWELYFNLGLGTFVSSLMLGLVIQYTMLLACRRSGRLPQFSTVAFVPAMKFTTAYRVFERRRALMMEIDEQLRELAARKHVQVTKIQQLKEVITLKIQALSSLDELSQTKLVKLAEEELEKIVSTSEQKASTVLSNQDQTATRIIHVCPYCKRLFRFNLSSGKETVTCPNPECGQTIRLPQVLSGDDDAPLILDVD